MDPDLDVALNESTVVGLRTRADGAVVLLAHVLTLPYDGDPRRALVFGGVTRNRVLLRRGEEVLPLADVAAAHAFLSGVQWDGQLCGWAFVDRPDLVADWPATVSLDLGGGPGAHSLFWFNECGRDGVSHCVEGVVDFTTFAVERADGTPVPLPDFVDGGRRFWQSLSASEEAARDAQRMTISWRDSH